MSFIELHQLDDPTKFVLVEVYQIRTVTEYTTGSIIQFADKSILEVADAYDTVRDLIKESYAQ